MNNSLKSSVDIDLRSLLKNQHKRVYSICRLFARTYKEHQYLFATIISAASQNIRSRKDAGDNQTLLLRACINMAALHSIALAAEDAPTGTIQFKSPDYQRSMSELYASIGDASDYEKIRLFLEFEKIPTGELATLTGLPANDRVQFVENEQEITKKNLIPYLKEKLIWS
jgi:hypothetical protein